MNIMGQDYKYFTTSAATAFNKPVEVYSIEEQKSRFKSTSAIDMKKHARTVLKEVPSWLPLAAEKYNISPSLKDYILAPVISLPSDLPNLNCQAFPYTELTSWVVSCKMPMYRTWSGSPVHNNHTNDNYAIAKGIIFSSVMAPIQGSSGNLWKVIQLVGIDRKRDPLIANEILTRERTHYSIGAYTQDYSCSICGQLFSKAESSGLWCEHVDNVPKFKVFNGKLAYWNVIEAIGFEISTLSKDNPGAYLSTHDSGLLE